MRKYGKQNWGEDPVTRISTSRLVDGKQISVDHLSAISGMGIQDLSPKVKFSDFSNFAPFETIFRDFKLEAFPFYNFWTADETTRSEERGARSLDELPRFVKLVWNSAPDIKRSKIEQSKIDARWETDIPTRPGVSPTIKAHGLDFLPAHDQQNFELLTQSPANGFLFPAVIETVVELPNGINSSRDASLSLGDEDEFLAKHGEDGVSYSEFASTSWSKKSSVLGAQKNLQTGRLSIDGNRSKEYLVDGQFAFSKSGGSMRISAVGTDSPAISHEAAVAASGRKFLRDGVDALDESLNIATSPLDDSVKVKFVHTDLSGLVSEKKISFACDHSHAESIASLGQHLGNLAVLSRSGMTRQTNNVMIPSQITMESDHDVKYIGYVIEKYVLKGGSYVLSTILRLEGREYSEFYDSDVLYGGSYRYRMRAVLLWSRPRDRGILEDQIGSPDPASQIYFANSFLSSLFLGEWSDWVYGDILDLEKPDPPDELSVRSDSKNKQIVVTMKVPNNPQRDINKMTILRKIKDSTGADVTDWQVVREYSSADRQGNIVNVPRFEKSANQSQSQRNVDPIEFAPQNARFVDSDVDYFQINGFRYVYSVLSHTRHDEISRLGDQIAARLNQDWKRLGEYDNDFVSCAGVELNVSSGQFSVFPAKRSRSEFVAKILSGDHASAFVSSRECVGKRFMNNTNYVLRVESLDTGEVQDVIVKTSFQRRPDQIVGVDSNSK